jgi:predicted Mrr-cat superfamily restriction endonuclease
MATLTAEHDDLLVDLARLRIVRARRAGERELDALSQGRLMVRLTDVGDLTRYGHRETA